ncbi:MAG: tyrosine-protein phosphatase [Candidatus Obscuribacterales bacterium]|nr:tyrosine-protein phosphatase [Candidatus Obscuribacterales bacterium]
MSPFLTTVNLTRAIALNLCLSLGALASSSIGAYAADSPAAVTARSAQTAQTTKAVKAKEDLPNFHQVHPFLYRGGEPSQEGLRKIKEMGITTIFDLRNPGEMSYNEKEAARELGMRYISMPMNSKAPTSKQIKRLLEEVDRASRNAVPPEDSGQAEKSTGAEAADLGKKSKTSPASASKQAVFVHCAHGSDRTGCMIGIWRVMRDGYDYDAAYKEMRKYWFTPKFTNLSGAVRAAAEQNLSKPKSQ